MPQEPDNYNPWTSFHGAQRRPLSEVDCPYFSPDWLLDNPEFPLDPRVVIEPNATKES